MLGDEISCHIVCVPGVVKVTYWIPGHTAREKRVPKYVAARRVKMPLHKIAIRVKHKHAFAGPRRAVGNIMNQAVHHGSLAAASVTEDKNVLQFSVARQLDAAQANGCGPFVFAGAARAKLHADALALTAICYLRAAQFFVVACLWRCKQVGALRAVIPRREPVERDADADGRDKLKMCERGERVVPAQTRDDVDDCDGGTDAEQI